MAKENLKNNFTYYKLFNGEIYRQAKQGEITQTRTVTVGKGDNAKIFSKEGIFLRSLEGSITSVKFRNQNFDDGNVIFLDVGIDNDSVFSVKWESKYAKNLAGRLMCDIDLMKSVEFLPYNSTMNNKNYSGIAIKQGDITFKNFYFNSETKQSINGIEALDKFMPEDRKDKDDWKIYFIKVAKFLKEEIERKFKNKFEYAKKETSETAKPEFQNPIDDFNNEDDLPF